METQTYMDSFSLSSSVGEAKVKRQRNMFQVKEQNKTPEKELNKKKTSNLLGTQFKTLIIRMLSELSRTSTV